MKRFVFTQTLNVAILVMLCSCSSGDTSSGLVPSRIADQSLRDSPTPLAHVDLTSSLPIVVRPEQVQYKSCPNSSLRACLEAVQREHESFHDDAAVNVPPVQLQPGQAASTTIQCGSCTVSTSTLWNYLSYDTSYFFSASLTDGPGTTTYGTTPNYLMAQSLSSALLNTYSYITGGYTLSNGTVGVWSVKFQFVSQATYPVAANAIANAANAFIQNHQAAGSTRGLFGAQSGEECVATLQAIMMAAFPVGNIGPLDSNGIPIINVDSFVNALNKDTANWMYLGSGDVGQAAAGPGDIWVQGIGYPGYYNNGQNHVGLCETSGCTEVISNSSTPGSFTWEATPATLQSSYSPSYVGGYYHHL